LQNKIDIFPKIVCSLKAFFPKNLAIKLTKYIYLNKIDLAF